MAAPAFDTRLNAGVSGASGHVADAFANATGDSVPTAMMLLL